MRKDMTMIISLSIGALAGCTRGADDRVQRPDVDFYHRTANHGPALATVATRSTDRARLSGNVVILTSGEELVYVRDAAFYQVPVDTARERSRETKALQRSLQTIESRLPPAPEPAESPTSGKADHANTPPEAQVPPDMHASEAK